MKKIFTFASLIALTTIITVFANLATAEEWETWYVSAWSGLNCRTEPTTDSDILTTYPRGQKLQVIGVDSTNAEWWETWDGSIQGWCNSRYLVSNQDETPSGMTYIGDFGCTTYTPDPAENGGSKYTAKGDLLTDVVGYAIAVDPNVIPYDTKVYIKDIGYRVARDCGGAIKGNKIDVLAWSNTMDALGGYKKHEVYIVN